MTLRLLQTPVPAPPTFDLPPFDLGRQPTRPGITHAEIGIEASIDLADRVRAAAASEALPRDVWIAVVIESERVLDTLGDAGRAEGLRGYLDDLARRPADPIPGGGARLGEFAKALRAAVARPQERQAPRLGDAGQRDLRAKAPYQAITAWRGAAIAQGRRFDAWALDHLEPLPRGRLLWEAAAAERGETLAEWVLVQAVRR